MSIIDVEKNGLISNVTVLSDTCENVSETSPANLPSRLKRRRNSNIVRKEPRLICIPICLNLSCFHALDKRASARRKNRGHSHCGFLQHEYRSGLRKRPQLGPSPAPESIQENSPRWRVLFSPSPGSAHPASWDFLQSAALLCALARVTPPHLADPRARGMRLTAAAYAFPPEARVQRLETRAAVAVAAARERLVTGGE